MNASNRFWRRMRARLIAERGGACEGLPGQSRCGSTDELEFAHVAPTGLNGRGRGYNDRTQDVRRHPEAYRLLCSSCHWKLDHPEPPPVIDDFPLHDLMLGSSRES
jgi:hypothetical protein